MEAWVDGGLLHAGDTERGSACMGPFKGGGHYLITPPQFFFFLGIVLFAASCTILWTFVHSSSGTMLTRSSPFNLLPLLKIYMGFDLSHTWLANCFSQFFFFSSLNFAMKS